MPRIGILSDIHGNLPALEQALVSGDRHGVDTWVCLGDVVDGGRWNNDCARLIRDRNIATVQGNHDVLAPDDVAGDARTFLDELPITRQVEGLLLAHVSIRKRARKVSDRYEAWNVFDETFHPLIFLGHSHISAFWSERWSVVGECRETVIRAGQTYQLPEDDRHIVSVGSLGYSRDADLRPRFGLFDTTTRELVVHPVAAAPIK